MYLLIRGFKSEKLGVLCFLDCSCVFVMDRWSRWCHFYATLPLQQRIVSICLFLQLTMRSVAQYCCQPFLAEGLHERLHVEVSSTITHCYNRDTIL